MTISLALIYLTSWSLIGAAAFSLIVLYLFRSGKVYDARTEEGHLKPEMPWKGILNMILFLGLIVATLTLSNFLTLVPRAADLDFWMVFLLNFLLITILILYDSLVIDWWVIGHWRPAFLQIPETMNKKQMAKHIRRTVFVAPPLAILLSAFSSIATTLIW